ncbi:MAG: N-acetylglucosaminyldiphosphoundecaprenol N-acetyl-beta-D-mannosaminyltransferase [Phycisphaerales bacterium]|jgi:N-acetylglucosaminyldiphosphoundecaprenol N-acetyl-beta-D-mannosaminyltransferase
MPSTTPVPSREPSENIASSRRRVCVRGIEFDHITSAETIAEVFDRMEGGAGGQVVTANLDHMVRASREPRYLRHLQSAELNVADGMPIVWASRLRGRPLPERVTGSDMVHGLVAEAAARGRSVFLLGGNPGVAQEAGRVWSEKHAGLRVAGSYCPPMGFEKDEAAMGEIRRVLAESEPDLVLVALGSPKQEYLIEDLREMLPQAWWIGVGISFSFVTGQVRRAPVWMQRIGLEWLFRLLCEPRRLAKRYLVDGVPFASVLLISAIGARLGLYPLYDDPQQG